MSVDALKTERTHLKARLTRLKTQAVGLTDVRKLKLIFAKIEPCLEEFDKLQTKIDILAGTDIDEAQCDEFEKRYFATCAEIQEKIEALSVGETSEQAQSNPVQTAVPNSNVEINSSGKVALPTINLPKFNGLYEEWLSFRDLFKSLIHENTCVSDIQKFHYLKVSLIGEAAKQIDSIELSAENYSVAWKLLQTRFENKKHIKKIHTRALLNLPNATRYNLREFLDCILKHTRSLKAMSEPVDSWGTILVAIVASRFDSKLSEEWEAHSADKDALTLKEIETFITKKCQIFEAVQNQTQSTNKPSSSFVKPSRFENKRSYVAVNSQRLNCPVCTKDHFINQCSKFIDMTVQARFEFAKGNKLCINCLKTDHKVSQCKSSNCRKCDLKHHTMLHFVKNSVEPNPEAAEIVLHAAITSQVFLSTATIQIIDNAGRSHVCRALLDSGSQSNFMTEACALRLKLTKTAINLPIIGIGNTPQTVVSKVNVTLKSRIDNFQVQSSCLLMKTISDKIPSVNIPRKFFKIPSHVKLADPDFNLSNPIDILIGAELFYDLMCIGQIKQKNHPTLQKTKFGWIVSGPANISALNMQNSICNIATLNEQVKRFWEIEEVQASKSFSKQEQLCEDHFKNSYVRNKEGRFVVELPTKESPNVLGESRDNALKRFRLLERKFHREPAMHEEYTAFIDEYLELGHMKIIPYNSNNKTSAHYYLPHHAVLKSESLTTKLRVVFDASAKTNNGRSLNDILRVGPTIQEDLFSLIIRFRTYKFAITADISKMYRQILVKDTQTSLQRILWRQRPQDIIKTFELQTLTYGTAPASYLATRCLQELAILNSNKFAVGAKILNRDFYMDDLIAGANSVKELKQIRDQLINILSSGGFELRKWASNNQDVISDIPNIAGKNMVISFDEGANLKTLGIQWNTNRDVLCYKICQINDAIILTKRKMLSVTASIFDPLGLIAPITVVGKILIQKLWLLQLSWDEPLPSEIAIKCRAFYKTLSDVRNVCIERYVLATERVARIEMHGFSDASDDAYGACLYIRTIDKNGEIACNLLCAKSRVAPMKRLSIPRLELCGALLLAKLSSAVKEKINLNIDCTTYWSDSTIAIAWIKSESKNFQVFIANRIGQIQTLTDSCDWRHVRTHDNPADVLSRGTNPDSLINNQLWWHGPPWLRSDDDSQWPSIAPSKTQLNLPEQRVTVLNAVVTNYYEIIARFSKYERLLRVSAYCYRFRRSCTVNVEHRNFGPLNATELNIANLRLIKLVQQRHFASELAELKQSNIVNSKSKLCCLSPLLKNGIIRVGGRLKHSHLHFDNKHPIILPADDAFTRLIIDYYHRQHMHTGARTTMALIRTKYWILNARDKIRKLIHKCVTCFRNNPKITEPIMGDLPSCRFSNVRPFLNCGIDFGGPIYIKEGGVRSKKRVKTYIALFVCLATRAIHIELVGNLSTDAFLAALKRFMSRRGSKVLNIWSDNATNFVGANQELNELHNLFLNEIHQNKLIDETSVHGINWHFIPPRAPHFGGIWEAGIKSFKYHLHRVVNNAALTYEEMYTICVQIEAILNSRPLTPISSDPNDPIALTPAHLLIGDLLVTNPEPDITNIKTGRLSRWQHLEQIRQHFWKRWTGEYITNLQQRTKWRQHGKEGVQIGDMVIIKEDNCPPLVWILGRVEEIHPGDDGIVRAATVRTSKGIFKRPARKLCIMPMEREQN